MAMIGLIVGTLAAGSGLLVLMTWLESSLHASLAPSSSDGPPPGSYAAELADRGEHTRVPA